MIHAYSFNTVPDLTLDAIEYVANGNVEIDVIDTYLYFTSWCNLSYDIINPMLVKGGYNINKKDLRFLTELEQ